MCYYLFLEERLVTGFILVKENILYKRTVCILTTVVESMNK